MSALGSLVVLAQAASEAAPQVGAGRIVGGWGYVWTSWGIAFGAYALYGLSLWSRARRAEREGVAP